MAIFCMFKKFVRCCNDIFNCGTGLRLQKRNTVNQNCRLGISRSAIFNFASSLLASIHALRIKGVSRFTLDESKGKSLNGYSGLNIPKIPKYISILRQYAESFDIYGEYTEKTEKIQYIKKNQSVWFIKNSLTYEHFPHSPLETPSGIAFVLFI